MKIDKSKAGWIFIVTVLSILLAASLYLGISGWFFRNEASYTTDLELGKTIQIVVKKNSATSASLNLDGSYLSGEPLAQIISIKNEDEANDLFLRAKIFIYSGNGQTLKMDLMETANWIYNDGYYYYHGALAPQNKIALCSNIVIPENTDLVSSKKYIVSVVVESLDSQDRVEEIWGYNPPQIA